MANIVLGACEAGGVVDGAAAWSRRDIVIGLIGTEGKEPSDSEDSRVRGVDNGIEDVKPGEGKTFEGGLFADVWHQEASDGESSEGVQIHG